MGKYTGILKKHPLFIASILILTSLFFIVLTYYLNRLGAFGCFDDCNNFMRGYFFLQGREMFSEIFSGHMPLMNYISAFIQKITNPESIYQLLLYHTLFLFGISVLSSIFLIARFKWAGILFVIFYEGFNIYLFGDRFLAEGIIVYPLAYMAGLVWLKFQNGTIYKWEYFLSAFITWFVIYIREPYIPLVLFLYGLILWNRKAVKIKILSFILFAVLSIAFLLAHPVNDFILQVYTINKINISSEVGQKGLLGVGTLKIFFYPILVFFTGEQNIMRFVLVSLNLVFVAFFVRLIMNGEKLLAFIIFLVLGLANIRYVDPGTMFYTSYHMLIWFGLLVMFTALMLIYSKDKVLKKILAIFLGASFVIAFVSPQNILWERLDTDQEIHDGYANYSINGRIIQILSNPDSTLFVDGGDDLIYWRAGLKPAYKYSWYTSLMPYHKPFVDARIEMFGQYPPDFYYGNCRENYFLPSFIADDYINIKKDGKKSCLYIKKDRISKVSKDAWDEANSLGFGLE